MRRTRVVVLFCGVLLVTGGGPFAAAHLAQNPANDGSPTSAGYGGPDIDPDPCRKESHPGPIGDTYLRACPGNNGVSGTYVGTTSVTAVECVASSLNTTDPEANCDSSIWTPDTGVITSFEPLGFAMTGIAGCDFEWIGGLGILDEEHIDNGPSWGTVPDGTWDDGGEGGACHVSGYTDSCPDFTGLLGCPPVPGNSPPPNANTNPPNPDNNAPTECTGTVWAEDWVMGDDVPILATCDSTNFTTTGLLGHVVDVLNCFFPPVPPTTLECVENETDIDEIVKELLFGPPSGEVVECAPTQNGSTVDTSILGRGDGHGANLGTGVSVPGYVSPCTHGDVVVFVTSLVSANPFGHDVGTTCTAATGDNADGTNRDHDCAEDDFGWYPIGSNDSPDAPPGGAGAHGSGDTVVYTPAGGWIDHFYDRDHMGNGMSSLNLRTTDNPDGTCTVWNDQDDDGVEDDGEEGTTAPCPDVKTRENGDGTVTVYDDKDDDGAVDDGEEIATVPPGGQGLPPIPPLPMPGDVDGDNIPDIVENELCGRPITHNAINDHSPTTGECVTTEDYEPPESSQTFFVPHDVSFGPDEDNDEVPATVTVHRTKVTVQPFNNTVVTTGEAPEQTETLDKEDDNPETPVPSTFGPVSVPTSASHSGDGDDDYVPGSVTVTWLNVTVNRSDNDPVSTDTHTETTSLDDDDNRNDPVPFDDFDADGDLVPDEAEPWICQVQNVNRDSDGKCGDPDGSDMDDYTPPAEPPNPWDLT